MYPADFDYHRAGSVDEALDLLGRLEGAKLLAGGHSLIPMMRLRLAQPEALIDISRCTELRGIEDRGDHIRIGALTRHVDVLTSTLLLEKAPMLPEAEQELGDLQVRNRGTVGGNIAHADPASDLPAVLLALGATMHLRGAGGERQVAADDFFTGLLETALGEGEILTAITVPTGGSRGSCYLKVEHPASGYALCGAAAVVEMDGGTCRHARLCFNGVTATPADAGAPVAALVGTACSDEDLARAAAAIDLEDPLGDIQASGEYRQQLARVYGRRALTRARDRAAG